MHQGPQTANGDVRTQLDTLRQMLLLALGASHAYYRDVDAAWQSRNPQRMQEALDRFDELPEVEKDYAMGLDHYQDELTGTD